MYTMGKSKNVVKNKLSAGKNISSQYEYNNKRRQPHQLSSLLFFLYELQIKI